VIRQPIVGVLGHVDHGKTSLLDAIRKTRVQKRESGGITQHIGASEVPAETINEICGPFLKILKIEVKIPGLLFIDTPGHEAFTNLRKRGGSIADIAVLVVDIMQGFQPQTMEAFEILKEYKTPFIIAANKIDMIDGWRPAKGSVIKSIEGQNEATNAQMEEKLYWLVGRLNDLGVSSERFDRVTDFTKQVVIVPTSARTGEGIPEMLMYLTGLSQKYLEGRLDVDTGDPGKGTILEVKEEKGLGKTIDVIVYDGCLKKNDVIVFGTQEGAASTKIRALLKPKPLDEIMDPREKFDYVDAVYAASGVKIFAPELSKAIAGSSLLVAHGNEEELMETVKKEIFEILVKDGGHGIILKADTIGSLEAITKMLSNAGVRVREAGIGNVTKRDVIEADTVKANEKYLGVILAFNVAENEDAEKEKERSKVPIIHDDVIYRLMEKYQEWKKTEMEAEKNMAFSSLVLPGKMKVLPGMCFRMSKPVICGVEIQAGRIKPDYQMIDKTGKIIGTIKTIQHEKETLKEATAGMHVAISMDEPIFDRQICGGDVLYTLVPKDHLNLLLEKYKEHLSPEEIALLGKLKEIRAAL
jgi:translation initiation factor 5B